MTQPNSYVLYALFTHCTVCNSCTYMVILYTFLYAYGVCALWTGRESVSRTEKLASSNIIYMQQEFKRKEEKKSR